MKWKKWIVMLLAFTAICVLSDLFMTYVIVYHTPDSDAGRIYHLYQERDDQIPIFGSSKARHDYIPTEIGINAFNYGVEGGEFDVSDVMLQIELAKHKTTPIILDLQIAGIRHLGDLSNYLPYLTDARFRELLKRYGIMEWRYYLPGIRYFGFYDWYLKEFINAHLHVSKKVVQGYTYDLNRDPVDPAVFKEKIRIRSEASYGYHPDADQNRRLIEDLSANPERLFFVVFSPYHSSCFAHFENADQFESFKERLKSFPNVVVIDWSRSDYPDDFFLDSTHLREKGAVDFSRKLGDKIREALQARKTATQTMAK